MKIFENLLIIYLFEIFDYMASRPSKKELGLVSPDSGHFSFGVDRYDRFHDLIVPAAIGLELAWQANLGEGSFGKVIQVTHLTDKCDYAVKLMPCVPGKREKYQERELKLLTEQVKSPITHKNIVKYYNSWKCEETKPHYLCIRMELCDSSLETLLQDKPNVVDNPRFYQRIFPQILSGLEYLHKIHWVHRDIYPPNILLAFPECNSLPIHSRVVKIADFGLARKLDQPSLTVSDPPDEVLSVVGNKLYRAPEMKPEIDPVSGSPMDPRYDYKVDLYSAGLVLYRLCRFFESPHAIESELWSIKECGLVDKHKLSHNDEVLHKLLDNLLNRNPEERLSASQALARFEVPSSPVLPEPQAASSETQASSSETDGPRTLKILARKISATSYVRLHGPCETSYDALVTCLSEGLAINDIECFNIIEESDCRQRIRDNMDWATLLSSAEKGGKVKLVVEPKSDEQPDLC